MSVTTKGLCATIALLCIVIPIGIGHIMPSDNIEKTGWESSSRVNITGDLINDKEYAFQELIGDLNNITMLQTNPISTSSNKSSIQALGSKTSTSGSAGTIDLSTHDYYHCDVYPYDYTNKIFSITYDGETIYFAGFYYYASIDVLTVYYIESSVWYQIQLRSPSSTITSTGNYKIEYADYSSDYVDIKSGSQFYTYFENGYLNKKVSIIITSLDSSHYLNSQITIIGTEGESTQQFRKYNDGWSVGGYSLPGTFKQVLLEIDQANNEVRLSGLVYNPDITANPYNRVTNTVTKSVNFASIGLINAISFGSSAITPNKESMYCYSSEIAISEQNMIVNNTANLANYYSNSSISYEIGDIAIYGDSVTLPGSNTSIPITNGKIEITGLDGKQHKINLKQSVIIADYDSDNGDYDLSINGIEYAENVSASLIRMIFGGSWYFMSYIYQITPYTYYEYVYDYSQNNLTNNELCLVGMLTSALSFVGCMLYGKKTQGKALWCGAIALLSFLVYFALLQ